MLNSSAYTDPSNFQYAEEEHYGNLSSVPPYISSVVTSTLQSEIHSLVPLVQPTSSQSRDPSEAPSSKTSNLPSAVPSVEPSFVPSYVTSKNIYIALNVVTITFPYHNPISIPSLLPMKVLK